MAHWSYTYPRAARFLRSRIFLLVAIPVALALLAGVVVGATQLIGNLASSFAARNASPGYSRADNSQTDRVAEQATATAGTESPDTRTETDPVTAKPAAVTYKCWNGDTVSKLSKCARPRTDAQVYKYLKYVYPAVADLAGKCKKKPTPKKYSDVAAYLNCSVSGVSNVRFRYWRDLDDANGHYGQDEKKHDGARPYTVNIGGQQVDGWVRAYNKPDDGLLAVTMFLPEHHLSLSIEGKSTKRLWAEFERTTIRPVEEMLGYPSADGPSVTVLGRG